MRSGALIAWSRGSASIALAIGLGAAAAGEMPVLPLTGDVEPMPSIRVRQWLPNTYATVVCAAATNVALGTSRGVGLLAGIPLRAVGGALLGGSILDHQVSVSEKHVYVLHQPDWQYPDEFRIYEIGDHALHYRGGVSGEFCTIANLDTVAVLGGIGKTDIYSVARTDSPRWLSTLQLSCADAEFHERLAYVATSSKNNGVSIVDLAEPGNPQILGELRSGRRHAYDLTIGGEHLATAWSKSNPDQIWFTLHDLSHDPLDPPLVFQREVAGTISSMAIHDSLLAIAIRGDLASNIELFERRGPVGWEHVATIEKPRASYTPSADFLGHHLIAAAADEGFEFYDLSDPSNPVLERRFNVPGSAKDIAAKGDRLYVADHDGGLRVLQRNAEGRYRQIFNHIDENNWWSVAVSPDRPLVAASGDEQIHFFREEGDGTLSPLGVFDSGYGHAYDDLSWGGRMLVARRVGVFVTFIDTVDPTHPLEIGEFRTSGSRGQHAWASGDSTIAAINGEDLLHIVSAGWDTRGDSYVHSISSTPITMRCADAVERVAKRIAVACSGAIEIIDYDPKTHAVQSLGWRELSLIGDNIAFTGERIYTETSDSLHIVLVDEVGGLTRGAGAESAGNIHEIVLIPGTALVASAMAEGGVAIYEDLDPREEPRLMTDPAAISTDPPPFGPR